MMGEIYGRAALVIAHTGHHQYDMGSDDSELASLSAVETVVTDATAGIENSRLNEILSISDKVNENSLLVSGIYPTDHDLDGEEVSNTSQPAISLMNYLARIWSSDDDYALKEDTDWKKRRVPDTEGGNERIWLRLFESWNDDWFFRSWVLQKAVLGQKVVLLVDDAAYSLDFVMKFWDLAKKRDTHEFLKRGPLADEYARILHLSPVTAMKALRDFKHGKESNDVGSTEQQNTKSDLLRLLSLSRIDLASDPRDKVYSLLGLAESDPVAKSIIPDYSEENTAAMLYRNVATKFVQSGMGSELLQYSGIDQKITGLPSWAPDWSHQSRSDLNAHLYNCSGLSVASLSISKSEPHKLLARGAIIDTIRWNGMAWRYYPMEPEQEKFAPFKEAPDTIFPPFTDEDGRCLIRTMAKKGGAEYCSKFDPSEGFETALGRTLAMDCTWRGERTKSDPSFLNSFNAFERLYEKGIDDNTPHTAKIHKSGIFDWVWYFGDQEESSLRRQSWPFEVAFQEAHKGRMFCATAEGYMCTAPYNTERGDAVVILEGFKMPFLLRKAGDDWTIVGDCYVHGIMDGELIVPLKDIEAGSDEISMDANGEPFTLRTTKGFAKFREFSII